MGYDFIPHSKTYPTALEVSNLDPSPIIQTSQQQEFTQAIFSGNSSKRIGGCNYSKQCKNPCTNPCGFVTKADIVLFGLVFVITYLIIILINPISLRKAGSDEIDRVTAIVLALFIGFIALALYSLKKY